MKMNVSFVSVMTAMAVVMMVAGFAMIASADDASCPVEGSCSKKAASVKSASCPLAAGAACSVKSDCPPEDCSDKKCPEKKEKSDCSSSCSDDADKSE